MLASDKVDAVVRRAESRLTDADLSLLGAYLEELIREEGLCHRAQVIVHQLSAPIYLLCAGDVSFFTYREHPARCLFQNIARIAKLCGPRFEPGDALFHTLIESIRILKSKRLNSMNVLVRVNADLEHVLKLAKIRAPAAQRQTDGESGEITDAKMIASLLIIHQCHRFDVSNALLYFSLTDWLSMIVVTFIQKGRDSDELRLCERMTFLLFYLGTGIKSAKRRSLQHYVSEKLKKHLGELEQYCLGHKVDFNSLHSKVVLLIGLREGRHKRRPS